MDYGRVISQSWQLIWQNKILWVLGFFAALAGGGTGYGGTSNFNFSLPTETPAPNIDISGSEIAEQLRQLAESIQQGNWGDSANLIATIIGVSTALLAILIGFVIVLSIGLSLIGFAARAGLIVAVAANNQGEALSLSRLLADGTRHLWKVVGLQLLLFGIPILLFILFFIFTLGSILFTLLGSAGEFSSPPPILGLIPLVACGLICIGIPVSIALQVTNGYAFRGIVLNNMGVVEGISHGWQIGWRNIGNTIILGLIFVGIGIGLSIALAIFVFWPLGLTISFGFGSRVGF